MTCRDWFQLSLKEGLTVYRDQEFSSDMNSRAVKRIEDVRLLRARQFSEDAGPMAHPIRPASVEKIDNFYTLTVYEKGAEVVRLYETTLGRDGFRKGMDLYFKRHDGQAVTCEDFFAAMRDANDASDALAALLPWYRQAGTPELSVRVSHDAAAGTLTLECVQTLPSTPDAGGDGPKAPQLIPLRVGLLGADGADLPLRLRGAPASDGPLPTCLVLRCDAPSRTFVFEGVPASPPPVPSLLRGFSAPVHLRVEPPPSEAALAFQLAHDSDAFARFEAAQTLGARAVRAAHAAAAPPPPTDAAWAALCDALRAVLRAATARSLDRVFAAEALSLPAVSELIEAAAPVDPVAMWRAREDTVRALAQALEAELLQAVRACDAEADAAGADKADAYDAENVQRRALRNLALAMLAKLVRASS